MGWDTALPCSAARSSSFFAILRVCFLSLEYNGDLSLPLSPSFSLLKGKKEGRKEQRREGGAMEHCLSRMDLLGQKICNNAFF